MQIKPFFTEYEEVSRKPLMKDDRGNQYSLVHFRGKVVEKVFEHPSGENMADGAIHQNYFTAGYTEIMKYHEGYNVLCDRLEKWQSGATSYDEVLYWAKPKKIERIEMDGLILQEAFCGTNGYFDGTTMNTKFHVWKRTDKDLASPITIENDMEINLSEEEYEKLKNILIWAALYDRERNNWKNYDVYKVVFAALKMPSLTK